MLAIERRNRILNQIQKNQSVIVSELSKMFEVTEETIRRDLEKLENDGFVKRTYGGAVFVDNGIGDLPFRVREHANKNEKKQIAKQIVQFIQENDTIMMDSSSTALEVAKQLKDIKGLVIITNSLEVLIELCEVPHITVISTGGILREDSLSLIGEDAENNIKKYNVDKAIISCKGIHIENGVTDTHQQEINIKQKMLSRAKQKILAVDHTKFNKTGFINLVHINDLDVVATNERLTKEWSDFFSSMDVEVVCGNNVI